MKTVKLLNQLRSFAVPDNLQVKIVHRKDGVDEHYHIKPHQSPIEGLQTIRTTKEVSGWARKNPVADNFEPQDTESIKMMHWLEKSADPRFKHQDWSNPVGGIRDVSQITDPDELEQLQDELTDGNYSHDDEFDLVLKKAFNVDYGHPEFTEKTRELGNVKGLWHGVANTRAAGLINTGFKTPRDVGVANGGMFGPGIYFADSPGKSAQYIGGSAMWDSKKKEDVGVLLKCDVVLGGSVFKAYNSINHIPEDNWHHVETYKKNWDEFRGYDLLTEKGNAEDSAKLTELMDGFDELRGLGFADYMQDDEGDFSALKESIQEQLVGSTDKETLIKAAKDHLIKYPPSRLDDPIDGLTHHLDSLLRVGQYRDVAEYDKKKLTQRFKTHHNASVDTMAFFEPDLDEIDQKMEPFRRHWGNVETEIKKRGLHPQAPPPFGMSLREFSDKQFRDFQKFTMDLESDPEHQKVVSTLRKDLESHQLSNKLKNSGITHQDYLDAVNAIGEGFKNPKNQQASDGIGLLDHLDHRAEGYNYMKVPNRDTHETVYGSDHGVISGNSLLLHMLDNLGYSMEQTKNIKPGTDPRLDAMKRLYGTSMRAHHGNIYENTLKDHMGENINEVDKDDLERMLNYLNPEGYDNMNLTSAPTGLEALTYDYGGNVNYPEYVVYDRNQAKIRKVLIVERRNK